ncbi:hypothetical protein SISSUDRAFT_981614 [Sistotremastrum suecicum HHB10207 ss-3]|uniref:Uncharacterized protein n=1 Tax=Sistotremastrum suecicum HHB10207 ss-3 TaxID=1314776 RepID=A0A166GEY4_9AGAM|nr:hypothetical protein SISSUDRAFT_981614 [Sistotremastrum suecicum HHB10207 ss-3]
MAHDQSHWHTIRPWIPRLTLAVREITSVSATFILSSGFDSPSDSSLDFIGGIIDDSDTYDEPSSFSDLSGRELIVKVNNKVWQHVVVDVDEDNEEATIVLWGLLPGRHYEIELNVLPGKENLRKHVITDADPSCACEPEERAPELPGAILPDTPPSTSLPPIPPPTISTPPRATTVEEKANQLRHNLQLLAEQRESLSTQLKNYRRDSQRAEASLRSEMDALKRSSEKQSAPELRNRQKALALQEAVKQAHAAAADAEEEAVQVDNSLPGLQAQLKEVEMRHKAVAEDAHRSEVETEEAISADRKHIAEIQSELSNLTHRLDRLTGKQERLEKEGIPEMEAELVALAQELEQLEMEEAANAEETGEVEYGSPSPPFQYSSESNSSTNLNGILPIGRPGSHAVSQSRSSDLSASPPRPTRTWSQTIPSPPQTILRKSDRQNSLPVHVKGQENVA